jgi:hypothetical protein
MIDAGITKFHRQLSRNRENCVLHMYIFLTPPWLLVWKISLQNMAGIHLTENTKPTPLINIIICIIVKSYIFISQIVELCGIHI